MQNTNNLSHSKNLLDPKNDFVFKRIFSEAPDLLCHLINAVRSDQPKVTELEVLNPTIDPQELTGKYIVLDLFAQDIEGTSYNVEMQVRKYKAWSSRSAYYLSRILMQQLAGGEDYQSLKPAIGIHLLDFELFDQPMHYDQAVWCFEMRDRVQPEVILGHELQLNLIELPKADRLGLAKEELSAWITFFEHWHEEVTMAGIAYPPVQEALEKVKSLSADDETRRLAFVRERALHDEASLLKDAKEEGREEGHLEGKAEILLQLLVLKFSPLPAWVETKLAQAGTHQLNLWAANILLAESIDQVFQDPS